MLLRLLRGLRTGRPPAGTAASPEAAPPPPAPATWVPPGHFYSPIADLDDLRARDAEVFDLEAPLPDVDLREDDQRRLFDTLLTHIARVPLAATADEAARAGRRYYSDNDQFGPGDAAIYAAMLMERKPRQVVEVGSGFSSAVLLDVNAAVFGGAIRCTFIEPYPDRLLRLLDEDDRARTRLIRAPVQAVALDTFAALEAGDILFVDSTHVSKAGSDVNHIFFRVLPLLKPGVLIHFHDIFHPFEYPRAWFFQGNRSWNELYLLRAFLMNNTRYRVVFFNSHFAHRNPDRRDALPPFRANPGGGFWMVKEG